MTNNILFINTSWEQEALVKTIYDKGFNIFGISKNAPSYLSLLKKHKKKLTELADYLLDKEVIFKEDLIRIFGERPFNEIKVEK